MHSQKMPTASQTCCQAKKRDRRRLRCGMEEATDASNRQVRPVANPRFSLNHAATMQRPVNIYDCTDMRMATKAQKRMKRFKNGGATMIFNALMPINAPPNKVTKARRKIFVGQRSYQRPMYGRAMPVNKFANP